MKKIIIAESIMRALDKHETIFGRGSIKVYAARSCEDILDIQRSLKADLIIADFTQPLMGGARLCSVMRSDADLKDVSIIMVCGRTEASLDKCRDAGANAVISKPIDPAELFTKMSELLVVPRRQNMRSFLHVSVNGRQGAVSFLGVSSNISISGLLLETEQSLGKGDRLTCTINFGGREVVAGCMVIRVDKQESGKFRYGMKFLNLDTKSLVIIEQFVKGRIKQ